MTVSKKIPSTLKDADAILNHSEKDKTQASIEGTNYSSIREHCYLNGCAPPVSPLSFLLKYNLIQFYKLEDYLTVCFFYIENIINYFSDLHTLVSDTIILYRLWWGLDGGSCIHCYMCVTTCLVRARS